MTCQLAACHLTDGMDEISTVEIFEPILIWVMSVGATVEIMGQGVLDTIFVASILKPYQYTWSNKYKGDLLDTPPHCT